MNTHFPHTLLSTENAMAAPSFTASSAVLPYMCRNWSGQPLGWKRGARRSDWAFLDSSSPRMLLVCIGSRWTNSCREVRQARREGVCWLLEVFGQAWPSPHKQLPCHYIWATISYTHNWPFYSCWSQWCKSQPSIFLTQDTQHAHINSCPSSKESIVSKYVNEIWSWGLRHCNQHENSFQMMS